MKQYTILAFMVDRPGVLNKIAILIRKKMYNIDTLTVCRTNEPGVSRMTITLEADDESKVENMVKQIEKQVEVISAKSLNPDDSFWREVGLFKLIGVEIENYKDQFDFKVLHEKDGDVIVQIAGTKGIIDEFVKEVGTANIKEVARTGATAMEI